MRNVSPAAPCSTCMPTELFCKTKESSSSWKVRDHIHYVVLGVANVSDIYEAILLAVRGMGGCFNAQMRALYCTNGVRKTSNRIKSPLDCNLFFSCIWKLYVMHGQLIYCIHKSAADEAVICPPCPTAPAEMFQWPKSPRSRETAHVVEYGWIVLCGSLLLAPNNCKGPWKQLTANTSARSSKMTFCRAWSAISCSNRKYAILWAGLGWRKTTFGI